LLSIIAVNFNKEDVLPDFFRSVYSNGYEDFELIFVDDCSTDDSVRIAEGFPCTVIRNEANLGPAAGRNLAARRAKGDVLVFTDTDITIDEGGLERIAMRFGEDGVKALFGKLEFPPLRNTAIGRYWLFEEHEVCHYGGVRTGPVNCWSSTLGAVDRELFTDIGGFNESFKGADIEDHELAAKILEREEVFYDEELTFHHHYPDTWLVLRKMFTRSAMFAGSDSIRVYSERSWVSGHRNTGFLLSASAALLLTAIPFCILFMPSATPYVSAGLLISIILKIFHHRRLFRNVLEREGIFFAGYCLVMLYLTSLFAMAGFLSGKLKGGSKTDD
jgi:glycosyltransferase involved in cell wall biosynthesis